jgi:glutaredoxin
LSAYKLKFAFEAIYFEKSATSAAQQSTTLKRQFCDYFIFAKKLDFFLISLDSEMFPTANNFTIRLIVSTNKHQKIRLKRKSPQFDVQALCFRVLLDFFQSKIETTLQKITLNETIGQNWLRLYR